MPASIARGGFPSFITVVMCPDGHRPIKIDRSGPDLGTRGGSQEARGGHWVRAGMGRAGRLDRRPQSGAVHIGGRTPSALSRRSSEKGTCGGEGRNPQARPQATSKPLTPTFWCASSCVTTRISCTLPSVVTAAIDNNGRAWAFRTAYNLRRRAACLYQAAGCKLTDLPVAGAQMHAVTGWLEGAAGGTPVRLE